MKTYQVSMAHALVLISMSLWGYFGSDNPSPTAFIPGFIGGVLVFLNNGIKKENKIVSHIAVIITLLAILGLISPLRGTIAREDNTAIFRVGLMMIVSIIAMVFFVRSFIEARKNKKKTS